MVSVLPLRLTAQFTMDSGELAYVKVSELRLMVNQETIMSVNSMRTNGKAMEYLYSVRQEIDTQANSRTTSSMGKANSIVTMVLYTRVKLEIASITAMDI